MTYASDFDLDAVLRTLDSVSKSYQPGTKEDEALRIASIGLLYVRHIRKLEDYRKYYQEFSDPSFQITVAHTFTTREEAEEWLASGKATDGELIRIAGQGFQVIQLPKGLKLLRTPLPEELDSP